MATASTTRKSAAPAKSKPKVDAGKTLQVLPPAAPVLTSEQKRAARNEKAREQAKMERLIKRVEWEEENVHRDSYRRLQAFVEKKLRKHTGKPYPAGSIDARFFKLEMITLGRELAEFGERIAEAAIKPENDDSSDCTWRLSEAMRDETGMLKRFETLRCQLFSVSRLKGASDVVYFDPKDYGRVMDRAWRFSNL